MKPLTAVVRLSWLIAVLAIIAAGVGLFYQDGGRSFPFTTLRGDTVQMYGQGLYHYETVMNGTGFKGTDAFMLFLATPLLVIAGLFYWRGSLRGGLVLTGILACFLYTYTHAALNYAYNNLFLIYVAIFSASLFALVLACLSFDLPALPSHFSSRLPRRAIAIYLFVVGSVLIIVWGGLSVLPALLQGSAPKELGSYTTLVTHALDMGIIAPTSILAGILLLRRTPMGYLLASTMVIVSWTIGGGVLALSIAQILAGALTGPMIVAFVVPFALLTLAGIWLSTILFGNFSERATKEGLSLQAARV